MMLSSLSSRFSAFHWPQPKWSRLGGLVVLSVLPWYSIYLDIWEADASQPSPVMKDKANLSIGSASPMLASLPVGLSIQPVSESQYAQWRIIGQADLGVWQSALATVAKQGWLPVSLSWQQTAQGPWQAEFILVKGKLTKSISWLPFDKSSVIPESTLWFLVSSMEFQGVRSALLSLNGKKRWVKEGSWLPNEEMFVSRIHREHAVLLTPYGEVVSVRQHKEVKSEKTHW